jgi:glutamine---fructose-6-phosphate transaminase (isomerizing)
MCGIVGCINRNDAKDFLLTGLQRLEYRGYDSAGLVVAKDDEWQIKRRVGRVQQLADSCHDVDGTTGIGHTRWATHGEISEKNCHPHQCNSGRFILTHNGVIENYLELKQELLNRGFTFYSQTDTEVIVNLLEAISQSTDDVNLMLSQLMKRLDGSYALVIMDRLYPNRLYALKDKSPLVVAKGVTGLLVASDPMALGGYSDSFGFLSDEEYVIVDESGFRFYDINGFKINKVFERLEITVNNFDKLGYDHHMMKEMMEEVEVIDRIIEHYVDNPLPERIIDHLTNANEWHIIACGTSYHAGLIGKATLEKVINKRINVTLASEFFELPQFNHPDDCFIIISQSGETADCRSVLKSLNNHYTITLTNVRNSTLYREATDALELWAGSEIAVASTKAYVAQIVLLNIMAQKINPGMDIKEELRMVQRSMRDIMARRAEIQRIGERISSASSCFYLGKGIDYYSCLEASLKLKEISYIHSEGIAAGELKHGPIALLDESTPVIGFMSKNHDMRSNLEESSTRKAPVITFVDETLARSTDSFVLKSVHPDFRSVTVALAAQLLSYYAALSLDRDVDKPRNLAKSVTVK